MGFVDWLRLCRPPVVGVAQDLWTVSGSAQPLVDFVPTSQALQGLDPELYDSLRLCDHRAMNCATVSGFAATLL